MANKSSSSSTSQTTSKTTNVTDSFNTTYNRVSNLSNVGNIALSFGEGAKASSDYQSTAADTVSGKMLSDYFPIDAKTIGIIVGAIIAVFLVYKYFLR